MQTNTNTIEDIYQEILDGKEIDSHQTLGN